MNELKDESLILNAMIGLRQRYVEDLSARQEFLSQLVDALGQDAAQQERMDELLVLAHKLCGTGATYGFPKVSAAARAVEDALLQRQWAQRHSEAREGSSAPDPDTLCQHIRDLSDAIGDARAGVMD